MHQIFEVLLKYFKVSNVVVKLDKKFGIFSTAVWVHLRRDFDEKVSLLSRVNNNETFI